MLECAVALDLMKCYTKWDVMSSQFVKVVSKMWAIMWSLTVKVSEGFIVAAKTDGVLIISSRYSSEECGQVVVVAKTNGSNAHAWLCGWVMGSCIVAGSGYRHMSCGEAQGQWQGLGPTTGKWATVMSQSVNVHFYGFRGYTQISCMASAPLKVVGEDFVQVYVCRSYFCSGMVA